MGRDRLGTHHLVQYLLNSFDDEGRATRADDRTGLCTQDHCTRISEIPLRRLPPHAVIARSRRLQTMSRHELRCHPRELQVRKVLQNAYPRAP